MLRRFLFLAVLLAVAPSSFAQERTESTTIILVRHAEKETGQDPSLNADGQVRARALRDALLDADVEALFASQFKRTSETVQSLADTLGLSVEIRPLDSSDVPASARAVAAALAEEYRGHTIVIAGHSNTIPVMASALSGVEIDNLDERDYDNLLIVVLPPNNDPQLIRAKYGAGDVID